MSAPRTQELTHTPGSGAWRRRGFLLAGAAVGGGLLVGCGAPSATERLGRGDTLPVRDGEVALNGWVKIAPDGRVTVAVPRAEMGQGVTTALPMLLAEELGARWEDVHVEAAPVARLYANASVLLSVLPFTPDDEGLTARVARAGAQRLAYMLSLQVTGASSSVRDAWEPMRTAGATARAMLVQAAAARWGVPTAQCHVEAGRVVQTRTGASLGFGELVTAAAALSPPTEVPLKDAAQFRFIGRPMPRKDVPAKVDGSARFGIDVRLPDMVYATIVQPPVFGARVATLDAALALKRPGVHRVLQIPQGVVVVASNWWRAQQAVADLRITYTTTPHDQVASRDIARAFAQALNETAGTTFAERGQPEAQLASATRVIEARYTAPFLAHATMEPMNCTAQWHPRGERQGQLDVWVGTQVPSFVQWKAAQAAGIDTEQVRLQQFYLGGGFGRRLETDMVEQAVAIAMQLDGLPVKLLWSREEDMQHDVYRPAALSVFRAGLDAQGRVTAWHNRVVAPSVGLSTTARLLPWAAADTPDKNQIEGAFELPYAFPHLAVTQVRPATHVPLGSWRSVGHSYNAFFTECFMDELAHAQGQDPVAYRQGLLQGHPRHQAVLALAARQAGWGQALPAGRARGVALHESFGSVCAQVAEVSIEGDQVRVHRVTCAIDCGVVVNPDTVDAQLQSAIVYGLSAALYGEITLAHGRVEQSSFPSYPVLQMAQMPRIDTHTVSSTRAPGGVGEPATPPIAPAVANALFALRGQRVRDLPIRLSHAAQ